MTSIGLDMILVAPIVTSIDVDAILTCFEFVDIESTIHQFPTLRIQLRNKLAGGRGVGGQRHLVRRTIRERSPWFFWGRIFSYFHMLMDYGPAIYVLIFVTLNLK